MSGSMLPTSTRHSDKLCRCKHHRPSQVLITETRHGMASRLLSKQIHRVSWQSSSQTLVFHHVLNGVKSHPKCLGDPPTVRPSSTTQPSSQPPKMKQLAAGAVRRLSPGTLVGSSGYRDNQSAFSPPSFPYGQGPRSSTIAAIPPDSGHNGRLQRTGAFAALCRRIDHK